MFRGTVAGYALSNSGPAALCPEALVSWTLSGASSALPRLASAAPWARLGGSWGTTDLG